MDRGNIECLGVIGEGVDAFAVQGRYVFAVGGYTLHVIDIADPARPVEVGWTRAANRINSVGVCGKLAFLGTDEDGGVQIVDVSDPAKPKMKKLDEHWGGNTHTRVTAMGDFIYSFSSGSLHGTHQFEIHSGRADQKFRKILAGHNEESPTNAYATNGKQIFCTRLITGQSEMDARDVVAIEDRTTSPPRRIETFRYFSEPHFFYVKQTGRLMFGTETTSGALVVANWPDATRVWTNNDEGDKKVLVTHGNNTVDLQDGRLVFYDRPNAREKRLVSPWGGRIPADMVKLVDEKAYVIGGSVLSVVDCADPARLRLIATHDLPSNMNSCAIEGKVLFAAGEGEELFALGIDKTTSVTLIGSLRLWTVPRAMTTSGDRLYAACGEDGLTIYDIHDPGHMKRLGIFKSEQPYLDVATSGTLVYALTDHSLNIVDARDPENATLLSRLGWPGSHGEAAEPRKTLKRLGNILYLVEQFGDIEYDSKLRVVDVSDPAAPRFVGNEMVVGCGGDGPDLPDVVKDTGPITKTSGWMLGLLTSFHISNENARYMAIYDLSNPEKPAPIAIYDAFYEPYTPPVLFKDRIYKADGERGMIVLGKREK